MELVILIIVISVCLDVVAHFVQMPLLRKIIRATIIATLAMYYKRGIELEKGEGEGEGHAHNQKDSYSKLKAMLGKKIR